MLDLVKLTSRKSVLAYMLLYLTLQVLCIAMPIISADFLDHIVAGDLKNALIYGLSSLAALVLYEILSFFLDLKEGHMMCLAWNSFCDKVKTKLEQLDWTTESATSNEIQQILGQEYEQTKDYIFKNQVDILVCLFTIVGVEVVIFTHSKLIFLLTIIAIPISIMLSTRVNKRLSTNAQENLEDTKLMKQYIEDTLILAKEERTLFQKQLSNFENLKEKYRTSFLARVLKLSLANNLISYFSLNLVISLTTIFSGYEVYTGTLTVGGLYAIQILVSRLWSPCEKLIEIKNDYANVKPMIADISTFLSKNEASNSTQKIHSISLQEYVSLDRDGQPICTPINCTLESGHVYVIRGDNGVGKTTLIESLIGYTKRFLGEIVINNQPIEQGVVNNFVYIPANPYISTFSVNGKCNLSSGQKKRLQINLALSSDKSAYIFDEPTNFLDAESKIEIMDAIRSKLKHNFVLIVTHDEFVTNYLSEHKIEYHILDMQKE